MVRPKIDLLMRYSILMLSLILIACREKVAESYNTVNALPSNYLKYATGFTITQVGDAKLIEVLYPYPDATTGYKYLLVQHGQSVPAHDDQTRIILVPIQSIICTSTTHIPLLDYLNETNALTGFPTLDYISSAKMRRRIEEGKIQELGIDKGMDLERVALLKPDLVMGYTMTADLGQFKKINELGIPVVLNAEYLEKHPLGRAEWIKFMACFFNKEELADSVFNAIEQEYLNTQLLTVNTPYRPTIMSGILYRDVWFLPGGQNYASRLLKDAGCRYLWEDDPSTGFLELSFESVYEKASAADLWIGVASFTSLAEIANADRRYTKYKPYQEGKVFTYNARKGAKGGSEFLEIGYLRPDIILKDLVKIAHPDLLPGHQLYFHAQLK
jgi:iron complex transport system substrate-binding protein